MNCHPEAKRGIWVFAYTSNNVSLANTEIPRFARNDNPVGKFRPISERPRRLPTNLNRHRAAPSRIKRPHKAAGRAA